MTEKKSVEESVWASTCGSNRKRTIERKKESKRGEKTKNQRPKQEKHRKGEREEKPARGRRLGHLVEQTAE